MARVSDENLDRDRIWLLNQLAKEEMPTLPDHRTNDFLDVIADLCSLRAKAMEAVEAWDKVEAEFGPLVKSYVWIYAWWEGNQRAIESLREATGEAKDADSNK